MAEPTIESAEQTLNAVEFKQLALTDINKWLTLFLEGRVDPADGDEEDDVTLCISQAGEYEYFSFDNQKLGMHIEKVDEEGGYEGAGEHTEMVFAVMTEVDVVVAYFQINGCYSSYDGIEWDDKVFAVYPKQVMVTQWATEKE